MFAFGPAKLLLLILVVYLVWNGWKFTRRVERMRRAMQEEMDRRRPGGATGAANLPAEDLVKCRICGAYVPMQSAPACGRGDCPYRKPGIA